MQQNETAIDVAKRKDHSEIILIITSQPKTKKEKKKKSSRKSDKEKLVVELEGEKKKKGFFFRKKSKVKVHKVIINFITMIEMMNQKNVVDVIVVYCIYKSILQEKEQKQTLYSAPSITAASEITTSHYDAHLPPHLMNQYKYQQQVRFANGVMLHLHQVKANFSLIFDIT